MERILHGFVIALFISILTCVAYVRIPPKTPGIAPGPRPAASEHAEFTGQKPAAVPAGNVNEIAGTIAATR
ncbi:MAG: hypothetical protein ACR2HH_14665 [Chthoniobacterales bacterium]